MRFSLIILLIVLAAPSFSGTFPLTVGGSGRYLVDGNGRPFFLVMENAWSMLEGPSTNDATTYFADRRARGNNALITMLPTKDMVNYPFNATGSTMWTGTPYLTPNPAYFAHAESVLTIAQSYGFYVLIAVGYIGYDTAQGFQAEMDARTPSEMKVFGQWMGNRFKDHQNIGWVLGGDHTPVGYQEKLDSIVSGIRSADTIHFRLFTTHNEFGTFAMEYGWNTRPWLNFNSLYSFSTTLWSQASQGWDNSPTRPIMLYDSNFEQWPTVNYIGGTQDPLVLKKQWYWMVLRGACGTFLGNDPLFGMGHAFYPCPTCGTNGGNWQAQLTSMGTTLHDYSTRLFRSRHWYTLVPDRDSSVMTEGSLSGTLFGATACASDSSSIIAFLPTARTVIVNPARLKGDSIRVWWYNPSNGIVTDMGMFSKVIRSYNQPSSGDWVMVIDGKGFNFNQPGNLAPRLVSPANSSTGQSLNPFLIWNPSEGAESYSVHLALDPAFGSTVLLDTLIVDTTRQVSGLLNGTTYFWRVRSRNSLGQSPWSLVWSFATSSSGTTQILHMVNGWNLISVPLSVPDSRTITLFPTATSRSFSYAFGGGYQFQNTLLNGAGYWLKFGGAQDVSVTGFPRTQDTIAVEPGWNIIGSISSPVDTSTIQSIPLGIRISQFYEYASGYTAAASIDPGKGYWVKTNAPGRLILSSGSLAQPASRKSSGTKLLNKR
jgi:hypothetical protein